VRGLLVRATEGYAIGKSVAFLVVAGPAIALANEIDVRFPRRQLVVADGNGLGELGRDTTLRTGLACLVFVSGLLRGEREGSVLGYRMVL